MAMVVSNDLQLLEDNHTLRACRPIFTIEILSQIRHQTHKLQLAFFQSYLQSAKYPTTPHQKLLHTRRALLRSGCGIFLIPIIVQQILLDI